MAAVHKINDDFYDDSFLLIALHSTLDDYAIVYALNKILKAKFKRANKDFDLAENSSFSVFEWQDTYYDCYWVIFANHSSKQKSLANNDLFHNEATYLKPRLIPELKDVDYFLRIEDNGSMVQEEIVSKVLTMPKVMAAYGVDTDKLKSKNNLIF